MWSYVKGLIIGVFLLWLLLFFSFALSDGVAKASIFSITLARAVFQYFQQLTWGIGIYILVFLIAAIWVWSHAGRRPASPAPVHTGENGGFSEDIKED